MANWNALHEHKTRKRGQNEIKGTRRDFESFYCGRGKKGNLRAMLWDVLYWECGWSAAAIGRAFGVTNQTVGGQVTFERWNKNRNDAKNYHEKNPEVNRKAQEKYFADWDKRFMAYMNGLKGHRPEYKADMDSWSEDDYKKMSDIYQECYRRCQEDGKASWHVDHIVPYAKGGRHVPDNVRILRAKENQSRPKDGSDILRP